MGGRKGRPKSVRVGSIGDKRASEDRAKRKGGKEEERKKRRERERKEKRIEKGSRGWRETEGEECQAALVVVQLGEAVMSAEGKGTESRLLG